MGGGGGLFQPLPPKRPGQLNLLSNGSPQSFNSCSEVWSNRVHCAVQCSMNIVQSMTATSQLINQIDSNRSHIFATDIMLGPANKVSLGVARGS